MPRKPLSSALMVLAILSLLSSPAIAQSVSTLTVKDGVGAAQQLGTVDCRVGVKCYLHGEIDTTGVQVDPATKQLQQSTLTALGLLFPAGGSIGNTVFGATQSGAWNITNVSGTVSLPTGASTAANQATGNASLSQLHTDLTSGLGLPSGAATAANQTSANTKLDQLHTDLTGGPIASGKSPVTGTFAATGSSSAFTPAAGKGIWVTLQGTWAATVVVERSIDSGTTWLPLTAAGSSFGSFSANAQEVVGQEDDPGAATYRLRCTAYTSGTVTYRIGHS